MKETDLQWKRAFEILDRAFDLEGDELQAFIEEQCAGQPELKAQVLSLVEADRNSQGFLESTAAEQAADLILDDRSGVKRFGPYQSDHLLGYGGMGLVYQASRVDGEFEQKVAIKCLRLVVNDENVRKRFLAERQILARLQHRSIAHILDGGVDEQGHPWFAMEFVDGEPITRYCERQGLSLPQRIALFQEVCDAVAYAHGNLVVHRDLKPANILVTASDSVKAGPGQARVKLLDFGVAKLLGEEPIAGDRPKKMQLLTPDYAAPEQVLGQPVTVTTDIYALGLLLYELLCGEQAQSVGEASLEELTELVCDQIPLPPSSRAKGDVRGNLKGELDAIVLKSLEKNPAERYQSVADLVEDLERHRQSRPVLAFRQDRPYRLAKFTRRYRWAVSAVTVIVLLLGGIAITSIRSNIAIRESLETARLEAAKSNEISQFLHQLFELADPFAPAGQQIPVTDLLSRGREQIFAGLENQPETRQALTFELAVVHNSLGQYKEAQELLEEALTTQQSLYGPSHPDIARTLHWSSIVADNQGDYELSESRAEAALAMRLELLDEQSAEVGESKDRLGSLLAWGGQKDRALMLAREAVSTLEAVAGPEDKRTQTARHNLAWMLGTRGLYQEAIPVYEQTIATSKRVAGPHHPITLETLSNYAVMLRHMGELQQAEQLYREVLEARLQALDERHPQVAYSQNNLAKLLQQKGQYDQAIGLYEESLATFRDMYGNEHSNVAISLANTAQVYLKTGRLDQAGSYFTEALEIHRAVTPPGSVKLASTLLGLGHYLTLQGEYPEARPLLEEALAIQTAALDAGHWQIAETRLRLGQLMVLQDQRDEARALLQQASVTLVDQFGPDQELALEAQAALSGLNP